VLEAMRACKFSLAESLDRGKQMVIRRAVANGSIGQLMPLPHVIEAPTTADKSNVSGCRWTRPNILDFSAIDADD
jgi:hypothetical protein